MKGFKKVLSTGCLLTLLVGFNTGCAEKNAYSKYAESIQVGNTANAEVLKSYFESKALVQGEVIKSLATGSDTGTSNNALAIVLYSIITSQNDEKLLTALKPLKAEAPTTNADIGVAFVNNALPSVAKMGTAAFLGYKMFDVLKGAGGMTVTGDGNVFTKNTGDTAFSSLSPVTTTTTTITETPEAPEE